MFVNTGSSTTISSGLVELDYIESTGVQAIDTLVIAKDITKVVTDFQLVSVVSGTESQVMAVWSDVNNCMQCGSDGTNFMATSRGTTYSQTSNVLARTIGTSAPVGSPNISISILLRIILAGYQKLNYILVKFIKILLQFVILFQPKEYQMVCVDYGIKLIINSILILMVIILQQVLKNCYCSNRNTD